MPTDRPKQDTEKDVHALRPSSPTSDDLSEYLPATDAAAEALMDAAMAEPKGKPDPALVAKLRELDAAEAAARQRRPGPAATAPQPASPRGEVAAVFVVPRAGAPEKKAQKRTPLWVIVAVIAAVALPAVIAMVLSARATDRKIAEAMASAKAALAAASATPGAATATAGGPSRASAEPAPSPAPVVPADAGAVGPVRSPRPRDKAPGRDDDPYGAAQPVPPKTADPEPPPPPPGPTSPPDPFVHKRPQ
jgi:hypothetical protein